MSLATTPRTPTRVSSRKTSPSPVSVPANGSAPHPRLVSPRRTRARYMRGELHGLFPLSEADEDDAPSRCPSLYYNAPTSPGSETQRSSLVYTPFSEDDDPFEHCTFSPLSDTFFDDSTVKGPHNTSHTNAGPVPRGLRSPIRTPLTPAARGPRAPAPAPYPCPCPHSHPHYTPQRILLPALPILAPCEQRRAAPSPSPPSTPLTPTTPAMDGGAMGATLVTALRDLLTCSEYVSDADSIYAPAAPVPGQFDDAVSPMRSHSPPPCTPPPRARAASTSELLRAPRVARGPREPLAPGLDGDHSVLAAMSADARADRLAAEAEAAAASQASSVASSVSSAFSRSSASSASTASSASSLASLCGMTSGMAVAPPVSQPPMAPRPPITPPPRRLVSSRRMLRSPLPVWS